MDRYYLKAYGKRFLMYDRTQTCGTNHLCIADFSNIVHATKQLKHMNEGNQYDPTLGRNKSDG